MRRALRNCRGTPPMAVSQVLVAEALAFSWANNYSGFFSSDLSAHDEDGRQVDESGATVSKLADRIKALTSPTPPGELAEHRRLLE